MSKITHLRIYKPDGEILEFERGEGTTEGAIDEISILISKDMPPHPVVKYEVQRRKVGVKAHFLGFPYSFREESAHN